MKKIVVFLTVCLLVCAGFLSGCFEPQGEKKEPPAAEVTEDKAIELLLNEIVNPSSSNKSTSMFMLSQPLQRGDIVTSNGEEIYMIENSTWFVFIDDDPQAFYAHPTRYVFIDVKTGSYRVIDEKWPPLINNVSMWDTMNLSKGDLFEMYPVLDTLRSAVSPMNSSAPTGDYGDAPDEQDAYYGVPGCFPTLYNTNNSLFGRPGGHTLVTGEEMLGINVSAEVDATDPNDPDGTPNLVDADRDERMFVRLHGKNAVFSFTVTVAKNASDVPRYINVLVDFDQNGNWTTGSYGDEWVVVNYEIDVDPGTSKTITTPLFSWGNQTILPSPVWVRVALTREQINETLFQNVGGWDGSGEFQYGEIEDHLVYLTDGPPEDEPIGVPWPKNPPGGKNPNPAPPSGPQSPGPSKGPCGTDVNYYVIIISGGDSFKHMQQGLNPVKQAADTITDLVQDQGYNVVANLGPGKSGDSKNTLDNIGKAFDDLKNQVKCGDHVLIYIVGHGNPSDAKAGPGINLKGSDGKTDELLTPSILSTFLNKIPSCPDEKCDTPGKCCHVAVVIESCYAGNFNTTGIVGLGRTVMGSSTDEPASGTNGGIFTQGFSSASRDKDRDTDGKDGVDPGEAFEGAEDNVDTNNKREGRNQEPWKASQECECKCPCESNISLDKLVSNGTEWVDEIDASLDQILQFKCEIENTGKCRNLTTVKLVDILPSCLDYVNGSSTLYYNGESMGVRPPCSMVESENGLELTWNLNEIELFAPGETITVEYTAIPILVGENINSATSTAYCTCDPSIMVSSEDSVVVNVS